MTKLFTALREGNPASILVNGHPVLLVSEDEEQLERFAEEFGADSVQSVEVYAASLLERGLSEGSSEVAQSSDLNSEDFGSAGTATTDLGRGKPARTDTPTEGSEPIDTQHRQAERKRSGSLLAQFLSDLGTPGLSGVKSPRNTPDEKDAANSGSQLEDNKARIESTAESDLSSDQSGQSEVFETSPETSFQELASEDEDFTSDLFESDSFASDLSFSNIGSSTLDDDSFALSLLAKAASAHIVLAPGEADYTEVLRVLENELPWVQ